MMPIFRYRASGVFRAMCRPPDHHLPAVVRERFIGVRHAVRVFALLHGGAAIFGGVDELVRQAHRHALLGPRARGLDGPAHRQGLAPRRADLYGHLVGGAADAAGLHLDGRLDVVERYAEHLDRAALVLADALRYTLDSVVDDLFRNG